jgi:hypothetical protein
MKLNFQICQDIDNKHDPQSQMYMIRRYVQLLCMSALYYSCTNRDLCESSAIQKYTRVVHFMNCAMLVHFGIVQL